MPLPVLPRHQPRHQPHHQPAQSQRHQPAQSRHQDLSIDAVRNRGETRLDLDQQMFPLTIITVFPKSLTPKAYTDPGLNKLFP